MVSTDFAEEVDKLQRSCRDLKRRKQQFDDALRSASYVKRLGIAIFFLTGFGLIPALVGILFQSREFFMWSLGLGTLIGSLTWLGGSHLEKKRLREAPPPLSLEEKMFLKLYPVIEDLWNNYMKLTKKRRAEYVRKKVARKLSKVVERSLYDWSLASKELKLTMEVEQNLRLLKDNLRAVIENIQKGERIQDCFYLLIEFAKYLLDPRINSLKTLNELMSLFPKPKKVSLKERISRHPKFTHVKNITFGAVVAFIVGIVQIYLFDITVQNAFGQCVYAFFTTLLIIYSYRLVRR